MEIISPNTINWRNPPRWIKHDLRAQDMQDIWCVGCGCEFATEAYEIIPHIPLEYAKGIWDLRFCWGCFDNYPLAPYRGG